jgi:hypothetical protein
MGQVFSGNCTVTSRNPLIRKAPTTATRVPCFGPKGVHKGKKRKGGGLASPTPSAQALPRGSLSDSLGRPPLFKTSRHKLGVGTHERKLTAIRGDEHVVTRAIRKG